MKVRLGGMPKQRFYHGWLYNRFGITNEPKVSVKIDVHDTWSMDHSLAHIVVPMLKQLRDNTHGAPMISYDDRPEHLVGTIPRPHSGDVDEYHFDAWQWALSEMLFAFESKILPWEDQFQSGVVDRHFISLDGGGAECVDGPNHTFKIDWEGRSAYQEKITNGFRLFGKYYESLWD
jgi:hypothetical protein|tara:strand:- start:6311 stop:6838 length:528 start_codon:yes stop_codon:yes gene_type:complete